MKRRSNTLCTIFLGALLTAPTIAQGGGLFGDTVNNLLKSTQDIEPSQSLSAQERSKDPVTAVTDTYMELHDYEGALKPDDYNCTQLVDPFVPVGDRVSEMVAEAIANSAAKSLTGWFGGGSKKSSKQELLQEMRVKAKRANWLTMEMEKQYGESLHNKFITQSDSYYPYSENRRVQRRYEQARAILDKIVTAITEPHDYTFQVFLLDDLEVSAYAMPGGYIYVTTGAIDSDHAELVMAHEVAHVLKRHQTRELQARLIDTASSLNDLQNLLKNNASGSEVLLETLELSNNLVRFSQKQEIQADACSVRIAARVPKVDLQEQIISLTEETLKAVETDKPRLFSSHPSYEERRQKMEEVAALAQES